MRNEIKYEIREWNLLLCRFVDARFTGMNFFLFGRGVYSWRLSICTYKYLVLFIHAEKWHSGENLTMHQLVSSRPNPTLMVIYLLLVGSSSSIKSAHIGIITSGEMWGESSNVDTWIRISLRGHIGTGKNRTDICKSDERRRLSFPFPTSNTSFYALCTSLFR